MDYAIEFWTLAANSGWNNSALTGAFLHALSAKVKDQLSSLELTNKIDWWIQDRGREKHGFFQNLIS